MRQFVCCCNLHGVVPILYVLLTLLGGCTAQANDTYIFAPRNILVGQLNGLHVSSAHPHIRVSVSTKFDQLPVIDDAIEYRLEHMPCGRYATDIPYTVPAILDGMNSVRGALNFTIKACKTDSCTQFTQNYSTHWCQFSDVPGIVIGETDKPLYRPGETVRFRFLTISGTNYPTGPNTSPKKKLFLSESGNISIMEIPSSELGHNRISIYERISIESPDAQTVKQWLDVPPARAFKMSYTLLDDAPEGKWKINAQLFNRNEKLTFEVQHYVLPRFVFDIHHPKRVTRKSAQARFSVCANYTNGPPMRGAVRGQFCVCSRSETVPTGTGRDAVLTTGLCPSGTFGNKLEKCIPIERSFDADGCAAFNLETKDLKLEQTGYYWWNLATLICVEVEEEGTGSKVSRCEFGGDLEEEAVSLHIRMSGVYRPGLPLAGSVQLVHSTSDNISDKTINLTIGEQDGGCYGSQMEGRSDEMKYYYFKSLRTDKQGVASFVIPPISSNSFLEMGAIYEDTTFENNANNHTSPRQHTAHHSIQPWADVSCASVQLWPDDAVTDVTCPGEVKLTLMSNVPLADKIIHVNTMVRGKHVRKVIPVSDTTEPCADQDGELGHYKCLQDGNNGIECLSGWEGLGCFTPQCAPGCNVRGGFCSEPGQCVCRPGWTGVDCSTCVKMQGCVHGRCRDGNDCVCDSGWVGYNCDRAEVVEETIPGSTGGTVEREPPIVEVDEQTLCNNSQNELVRKGQKKAVYQRTISLSVDGEWGAATNLAIYFYNNDSTGDNRMVAVSAGLRDMIDCTSRAIALESQSTQPGLTFSQYRLDPGQLVNLTIIPKGLTDSSAEYEESCFFRLSDTALDSFSNPTNTLNLQSYSDLLDKHMTAVYMTPTHTTSVKDVFDAANLLMIEIPDQQIRRKLRPLCILRRKDMNPGTGSILNEVDETGGSVRTKKPRMRVFFPEVWEFEVYPLKGDGGGVVRKRLTAPDSITSWRATAFCTTPKSGLWIPKPQLVTVSMPFFTTITLPKQVKRGEIAYIPISVFVLDHAFNKVASKRNNSCYHVTVMCNVDPTVWLQVGSSQYSTCLCGGGKQTFLLGLLPKQLGKLNVTVEATAVSDSPMCVDDTEIGEFEAKSAHTLTDLMRRAVRVVPEGVPEETNIGSILCLPDNGKYVEKRHMIPLPTDIIPGSLRMYLSYTDELLGPALENLDRLVRLPVGCGEQNMVLVAPNVYVLDYLKSVPVTNKKQTETLLQKARRYIISGHHKQLKYRRNDGSFSAFGMSDKQGSTWLTAFVLRVFAKAQKVDASLNIDWNVLFNGTITYLKQKQNQSSGCFEETGHVLHSAMQGRLGGDNNEDQTQILLTAYVLSALFETKPRDESSHSAEFQSMLSYGWKCLDQLKLNKTSSIGLSTYALAQIAYVYTMIDSHGQTATLLRSMLMDRMKPNDTVTNVKSKLSYWTAQEGNRSNGEIESIGAADLETTSYAYLTLAKTSATNNLLAPIVHWLASNRKKEGGFYSTQDTVLALEVITDFAKRLGLASHTESSDLLRVSARLLESKFKIAEVITDDKRRLLNQFSVPPFDPSFVPSVDWTLASNKTMAACIAVQTTVLYNLPYPDKEREAAFELIYTVVQKTGPPNNGTCTTALLTVCVLPSKHQSVQTDTGMLLVRVKMVSGWQADHEAIAQNVDLQDASVRRVEFDDQDTISLYYNGFTEKEAELAGGRDAISRCTQLPLHQKVYVENARPATINVMDYYATERSASVTYTLDECRTAWQPSGRPVEPDPPTAPTATETTLTEQRVEMYCPRCVVEFDSEKLGSLLFNSVCRPHNDLYLVKVRSTTGTQSNVTVTVFRGDGNVGSWNASLSLPSQFNCSCPALENETNLLLFADGYLDMYPGDPHISVYTAENTTTVLSVRSVVPGLNVALSRAKKEKNSTATVDQSVYSDWSCKRLVGLKRYINWKKLT